MTARHNANMLIRSIYLMVAFLGQQISNGQLQGLGCPLGWELHGDSCYQFVFEDTRPYDEAASACWTAGSALLSVNNIAEHNFISNFLSRHGLQSYSEWYTSGQVFGTTVKWNGDGTYFNTSAGDSTYWINLPNVNLRDDRVVYKFSASLRKYGWSKTSGFENFNYICELPTREVFRLIQNNRGFDFGIDGVDSNLIPQGPKFQMQTGNIVIVGNDIPLIIDCIASGQPQPNYYWFVKNLRSGVNYELITTATSHRYTLSNGRLTINEPNELEDAGIYQCKAENTQGSIISAPSLISFGYLNQFSPNQQGFVEAMPSQGTFITCNPPSAKPALTYTWYKDDISNFIRPELNNYFFISANGNLYLSEAHQSDAGNYYCVVTLVARVGEQLSTSQPPSRTSKAIELRVPGSPLDFGPIIHPDFIAVFPKPPLVGQEVRLECFAYGRMPMDYRWSRKDKPFPVGTQFMYDNRVMIIPNAQFADSGNYTCTVVKMAGAINIATKTIALQLEAKPYFVFPVRDIHADVGSDLTWRCEARAIPRPTYTWYKNSEVLTRIPGEVEVRENVLYINRLDKKRDQGMYQCGASNIHGTAMSTAQLRVLSIKPSFAKNPLPTSIMAAVGGNLTITCNPEAAPQPEITWLQNGHVIGYSDSRREILLDGTLHIRDVTQSDQGSYTCKASNVNGEDESRTQVTVLAGIQFQTRPVDTIVNLNKTAFLFCEASYDANVFDLNYAWKFNGKTIHTKKDPFYKDGTRQNMNGLYIVNAQYRHSGVYDCEARTAMLSLSVTAILAVHGPPTEPAGVFVEPGSGQNRSVTIVWTWNPSADNGFPVIYFQLEAINEYSSSWVVLAPDIPQEETVVHGKEMKRSYVATDLLPYNSYRFRVRAKNDLGVSPPSRPSEKYRVPAAPPVVAPTIINTGDTGGGSEGLLKMQWQALSLAEEGGLNFGYKVYWRLATEKDKAFKEAIVGNVTEHYSTVGRDYYYLQYAVKIQAYNKEGFGPVSEEFYVYSAEGMPVIRPTNVKYISINGTAITVTWEPVPDTREAVKGRVRGYRVDFFDLDPKGGVGAMFVYGNEDRVDIVGLEPHHDYWLRVTVFNSAGLSTQSEQYLVNMLDIPPQTYPQVVEIYPHGEHSIRVKCRGIPVLFHEAQLLGYRFFYWPVADDPRSANFTETDIVPEGVIHGLQNDVVYSLRVSGYSRAGDGKKSVTMYFVLLKGGSLSIYSNFDPSTSEVRIGAAIKCYYSKYLTFLMFFVFRYFI